MKKQILLPTSTFKELRATFKINRMELWRALNYERNSDRARMLRCAALERGGLIYTGDHAPKGFCPDVETRHDHVGGVMYQAFGERVELQVSRETGAATIIIDGEVVVGIEKMALQEWGDVLYGLQKIYNQLNS